MEFDATILLMTKPMILTSDDPIIKTLDFKPYQNAAEKHVRRFLPNEGEAQSMQITTPWGAELSVDKGDYIISEIDNPNDHWPINPEIFDATYEITRPGHGVKKAITLLVPLKDVTSGDENRQVEVHTLEGVETVRAGDYYLAKGVKGEIWPMPKEKVGSMLVPAR
jgi:hypothetical protein